MSPSHACPLPGFPRSGGGAHPNFPLLTLVKRWISNAGYYPVLVIFSQRNSPASEPGQRVFSVSRGTAGNRLDCWLRPTARRGRSPMGRDRKRLTINFPIPIWKRIKKIADEKCGGDMN